VKTDNLCMMAMVSWSLLVTLAPSLDAQQKTEIADITPTVERKTDLRIHEALNGVQAPLGFPAARTAPVLARPHLGKLFWVPWIANFGMLVATTEMTENCLHAHPEPCVEGDPILSKRPSRVEIYGIRGGLLAGAFYFARRSKLHGGSSWKYGTALATGGMALDTSHDAYMTVEGPPQSVLIANQPARSVEIVGRSASPERH
jgi:hypothetical protein